jgi:hypothetical protein
VPSTKGGFSHAFLCENGVKAAFSTMLLLTKNQKGFIKSLEPADCRNDFSNTL